MLHREPYLLVPGPGRPRAAGPLYVLTSIAAVAGERNPQPTGVHANKRRAIRLTGSDRLSHPGARPRCIGVRVGQPPEPGSSAPSSSATARHAAPAAPRDRGAARSSVATSRAATTRRSAAPSRDPRPAAARDRRRHACAPRSPHASASRSALEVPRPQPSTVRPGVHARIVAVCPVVPDRRHGRRRHLVRPARGAVLRVRQSYGFWGGSGGRVACCCLWRHPLVARRVGAE